MKAILDFVPLNQYHRKQITEKLSHCHKNQRTQARWFLLFAIFVLEKGFNRYQQSSS